MISKKQLNTNINGNKSPSANCAADKNEEDEDDSFDSSDAQAGNTINSRNEEGRKRLTKLPKLNVQIFVEIMMWTKSNGFES